MFLQGVLIMEGDFLGSNHEVFRVWVASNCTVIGKEFSRHRLDFEEDSKARPFRNRFEAERWGQRGFTRFWSIRLETQ
jgi:hypothetical protein